MSTKVKFDFNSIKFRLWLYFLAVAVVILALIWFLQVFLLNNSYENMKIKQVSGIATEIKAAYQANDEYLTQKIQQLSVTNDYYAIMQKNNSLLLFTPGADSTAPINQYAMHIPEIQRVARAWKRRTVLGDSENPESLLRCGFRHFLQGAVRMARSHGMGMEVQPDLFCHRPCLLV